jgi:hypothetical protein
MNNAYEVVGATHNLTSFSQPEGAVNTAATATGAPRRADYPIRSRRRAPHRRTTLSPEDTP